MAFVFKTERELDKIKTSNSLGPGEYLPLTELRKYTISKEPFLSSMKEHPPKINDVPGPGAYYHDDTLIKYLKNIQNEKISEQNDKVHLIAKGGSVDLHPNTEKIGFNSKTKRFKVYGGGYDISPGPGQYFSSMSKKKDKASKLREEEFFSKQKIKIKKINEFQRIPTIPSKLQEFGFDILDNGSLVQKQNPDMYKTFTGEKGDTVGPGSYEIEKPSNWRKTGTEWSKLKVERDFNKKAKTPRNSSTCLTSTNYSENGNTNNINTTNTKNSFYLPTNSNRTFNHYNLTSNETETNQNFIKTNKNKPSQEISNINNKPISEKNVFKCRIVNCMRFNGKKLNKKETFESVIKGNYPGPGYYYDPFRTSSFFFKPTPEFKQFFGSRLERFSPNNNTNLKNNLGPGEYFEKDMNKTSIGFAPFSSKTNRFQDSFFPENKMDLPGPGEYTLKSFTYLSNKLRKNSDKIKAKFGSNEKRFADVINNNKWKYSIPGPGYYNTDEENKIDMNKKLGKTFYGKNIFNLINKTNPLKRFSFRKKINKDKIPPIGTYNPGMIFSIDYNNKKKVFETKNSKSAFETTFNKKKKIKNKIDKNNINIGPGYYYHEKKQTNLKPSPQFYSSQYNNSDKWFKNSNPNVGPGKYDINNYYEWNKKSFNINFV